MEYQARLAWAEMVWGARWTLWVGLSFARPVSEYTASKCVSEWAARLRSAVPGTVIMSGIHTDVDRVHVHAMIFLPRHVTSPNYPRGVQVVGGPAWEPWLALLWKHGLVWAAPFDATRGDAGFYTARNVGAVDLFGQPVGL